MFFDRFHRYTGKWNRRSAGVSLVRHVMRDRSSYLRSCGPWGLGRTTTRDEVEAVVEALSIEA